MRLYDVLVLSNPFFCFVISHDFHAQICFHSHLFTAHTSLGYRKCLIGMIFDPKPDKLLSRTLYRALFAAHVILKIREEDAINDALFAPLSNYREKEPAPASWLAYQTKRYGASKLSQRRWSSRLGRMKPSDFDKCEICIYCKITHKQDNKL